MGLPGRKRIGFDRTYRFWAPAGRKSALGSAATRTSIPGAAAPVNGRVRSGLFTPHLACSTRCPCAVPAMAPRLDPLRSAAQGVRPGVVRSLGIRPAAGRITEGGRRPVGPPRRPGMVLARARKPGKDGPPPRGHPGLRRWRAATGGGGDPSQFFTHNFTYIHLPHPGAGGPSKLCTFIRPRGFAF
jgi:hypothetical protein